MVLATSVNNSKDETFSEAYCEALADKLNSFKDIPVSCRQYPSVIRKVESKDAFKGMDAGSAAKARAARAQGKESHAQIQRRITTRATQRFSKLDK